MAHEGSLYDQFSALIGQSTRVKLRGGTYTYGVLYCIDPVTSHVALLCPTGRADLSYNVKVVFAHSVQAIEKGGEEGMDLPSLAALQQALHESDAKSSNKDTVCSKQRLAKESGLE